jgi:hypothetical protein
MSEIASVNAYVVEQLKKERSISSQALNSTINDISIIAVSQNVSVP